MTKKEKKEKKQKQKTAATAKQEVDAVKGFIFVMILLIVALGVFIVITNQRVSRYDTYLSAIKQSSRTMGLKSLEVKQYLELIGEKDETVLLNYPVRFFQNRYRTSEVGVREEQVTINRKKEMPNRKEQYTEISWTLDMRKITRQQAGMFLWGVEEKSAKAKAIELSLRRDNKKGDATTDSWSGGFKVGYRVAGLPRRD